MGLNGFNRAWLTALLFTPPYPIPILLLLLLANHSNPDWRDYKLQTYYFKVPSCRERRRLPEHRLEEAVSPAKKKLATSGGPPYSLEAGVIATKPQLRQG